MVKQHPYWRPANKVHPELKQVREEAGALTDAEKKRIEDAKKAEEERQERKRRNYLSKHGIDPDPAPTTKWDHGREGRSLPVNQTENCKIGNYDAKKDESVWYDGEPRLDKCFGRISKQSEVQKSGVNRGYVAAMKPFEMAHGRKKVDQDRPKKPKEKDLLKFLSQKSRGRVYY